MTDPRFSVIIPSYNGGQYLKQCVGSVLAQTCPDWELVVLDDGSDDGSLEWLQSLGEPRLRLCPAPEHLGIVGNWRRILTVPKAEFMTILGQDDLLDPDYLRVMDDLTRAHPDATLFHAHFRFINAHGRLLRHCRPLPARETAAQYLTALLTGARDTYGSGYLMRSARYEAVGGIPDFPRLLFADDALWVALMEGSYKATAPQECFACRLHPQSVSGGTGPDSWMAALPLYLDALQAQARRDPDFARALAVEAPGYLLRFARSLYVLALTRATRQGRRVAPAERDAIAAALARLAPQVGLPDEDVRAWDAGRGLRVREWINRHAAPRRAYSAYVRLRHGGGNA